MRGRFLAVLGVLSALVFPVRADSDPIRLTLACESATEPTFRLTFQSVASEPTAIVIGAILGNDRRYALGPLRFVLTRGSSTETIDYFDVVAVGGRLDQWLIPLPVGTEYSVPLAISNGYRAQFAAPTRVRVSYTAPGNRPLNPDLKGLQFIHVWTGMLDSNQISVPDSCHR
jgi:hypothetical protein